MRWFLTPEKGHGVGGKPGVKKVFHLSAAPTVTAGFIGFVFDIRK
jgi:hypothetical protein